jgi:HK97 gp10 family phage protein
MSISVKFSSDVEGALSRLGEAMGERALRAAAFEGSDIIRDEVVQRAPVLTGLLKSDVLVKRLEEKSDGNQRQTYLITVRTGSKKYTNNRRNRQKNRAGKSFQVTAAFYWRFIEFGTSKMAAKPFMRPAFDSTKQAARQAIRDKLADKLREFQQGSL